MAASEIFYARNWTHIQGRHEDNFPLLHLTILTYFSTFIGQDYICSSAMSAIDVTDAATPAAAPAAAKKPAAAPVSPELLVLLLSYGMTGAELAATLDRLKNESKSIGSHKRRQLFWEACAEFGLDPSGWHAPCRRMLLATPKNRGCLRALDSSTARAIPRGKTAR